MTKQKQSLKNLRDYYLDRRNFIKLSSAAAAGLVVSTSCTLEKVVPVIAYVGRLATAVGTTTLANLISEYIAKNVVSKNLRNEVTQVNIHMAKEGGFDDLSVSVVYGKFGYFFYAARHNDKFNICIPFFDASRVNKSIITMVEGPSVVGLALAAERIAQKRSKDDANAVLLPQVALQRSVGTFQTGYSQPDRYTTKVGTVDIGYQSNGKGEGTVNVRAIRSNPNQVLLDENYDITYTA
jgi:hypothetical protein